ncbi:GNAT family N-acetyltransferase [Streptomyces sp. NPDC048253]|uniref:GNAT family N-acetyltransferase n=1 Tax=Streptomyces sp. NPDC048253 TaxID=3365524 RepID=UPI00371E12B3
MPAAKRTSVAASVSVRSLAEPDLDRADEIFRVAFGTFLGAPEPETFFGTADYVRTRWAADPHAAFAATVEGEVVGSNFAANWGSVGFFGPLTVRPDLWDQGIGRRLMEPVMACFDTWENRHLGLFTFSHSPKHLELYRRYGFWPWRAQCIPGCIEKNSVPTFIGSCRTPPVIVRTPPGLRPSNSRLATLQLVNLQSTAKQTLGKRG